MKNLFRHITRPLLERRVKRLIAAKNLKVVAVAGAVGKSSTKMAIATVLRRRYRVLVQEGNFNTDISLPMSVFGLDIPATIVNPFAWIARLWAMDRMISGEYPYDILVLELGTDHPGEIAHFMSYLRPEIGVVTAVAAEHMEFFADLDAVAREELALVPGCKRVLINRDDVAEKYWREYVAPVGDAALSYGLGEACDYQFSVENTDVVEGTWGAVRRRGAEIARGKYMVFGLHSAKMLAAAAAVGELAGLSADAIAAGLEAGRPFPGRMNLLAGLNGTVIIDDSYNSSPEAALAAISALMHAHDGGGGDGVARAGDMRAGGDGAGTGDARDDDGAGATESRGRRIAIMGSMNELGGSSAEYHRQVGTACASLDLLLVIGDMAVRQLGPAAVAAGLAQERLQMFESPVAAGRWLRSRLRPGDIILVKGSQNGVFAEEAAKLLLANPADEARLVRQSPAWLSRKRAQFADIATAPAHLQAFSIERHTQQSLTAEIGEERALAACVPTCFYMVARAFGYFEGGSGARGAAGGAPTRRADGAPGDDVPRDAVESGRQGGAPIAAVNSAAANSTTNTPATARAAQDTRTDYASLAAFCRALNWDRDRGAVGWIRPALSADLRGRYGWPIVSWRLGSPAPDTEAIERMTRAGYIKTPRERRFLIEHVVGRSLPEIVAAAGAVIVSVKPGFGGNDDGHAIIITSWTADEVLVVDPDDRNPRQTYDPEYILDYLNPDGAGSVILPRY